MNYNYKFYGIFLLIVSAILVAGFLYSNNFIPEEEDNSPITNSELEAQYDIKINEILSEYSNNTSAINETDFLALTTEALDQILSLKVSSADKDSHLAIVLTLNKIKSGLAESDSLKVRQGIEEYNELIPDYPIKLDI